MSARVEEFLFLFDEEEKNQIIINTLLDEDNDLYHDITIEKDIVNFDHFTMYDLENIMNRIELSKIKLIMVCTIEMLDLIIHDSTKKLTQSIKSKISMYELL